MPKRVIVYAKESGKEPFTEWLYNLRDAIVRKRILARVSRLQQGSHGDCEPVGEGVSKAIIFRFRLQGLFWGTG
jgi:putative addiction module killer protein